jgi:rhodanese-related sulfurtransferase
MSIFPTPAPFNPQSEVKDLKSRLDWGEPALTIIDIRSLEDFNKLHIQGAVAISPDTLVDSAKQNLETDRDIYIYSDRDEQTASAANNLREAGYDRVAELKGGLNAWQNAGYPVESISQPVG